LDLPIFKTGVAGHFVFGTYANTLIW